MPTSPNHLSAQANPSSHHHSDNQAPLESQTYHSGVCGSSNPSAPSDIEYWVRTNDPDQEGKSITLFQTRSHSEAEGFRSEVKSYPNYHQRPVWVDVLINGQLQE